MGEIPFLSYTLMSCVLLFIFLTGLDLAVGEEQVHPLKDFKYPIRSYEIITSISILTVAFSYQTCVYPAYTAMQDKSTDKFLISSVINLVFCALVYTTLGLICLVMFGSELQSNVLLNMSTRPGYASILIRLIFSLVLTAHIPYIFFIVKESYLVLIDEIWHRSVSEKLEAIIKSTLIKEEEQRYLLENMEEE